MNLEYVKSGDYYIPMLRANEEPDGVLTKWGLMRKHFLKEHRSGVYSGILLTGELKAHCLMIQEQAEAHFDILIDQMAREQGLDEALKRSDQMKWVRMMNNIRAAAEELVREEIVFQ